MKNKQFIGSNLALFIGIISVLGGAAQPSSLLAAGLFMVLGALAYKSAKKRKLGISAPSTVKFVFELIAIAVIVVLMLFTKKEMMIEDPVPNIVIPIWAVIAYIVAVSKNSIIKS